MGLFRRMTVTFVTTFALMAGPAQSETLADALIAAYRNSHLLDQNQALLRAADEDVALAMARLRPVINFTLQSTYANTERFTNTPIETNRDSLTTAASLTADLTIYEGGRGLLAVDVAKEAVLATREALVDVEQRVLITAVTAYVNVRLAQEIVSLRNSNVRLITQELRAAQDRFDVGEITRTDVALAESRLASSRASLAAAEGDLQVARESYKAATGAYPGKLAALPKAPPIPATMEEARKVAVRTHPQLRQAQRQTAIDDLNVKRAEGSFKPSLTARAGVSVAQQGAETENLALTFNQTIYAGGQLAALQRKAIQQREASRSGLLQTTVQVEQNIGTVWANLDVATAQIQATDGQITAAQTAFDGLQEEAKLGARTTLDVLNAEQELLDARAARIQAVAERYVGVYNVLQAMGLLTVDHLQLGIPTYDPAAYYNAVKDAPAHSVQGKKLDRILRALGEE